MAATTTEERKGRSGKGASKASANGTADAERSVERVEKVRISRSANGTTVATVTVTDCPGGRHMASWATKAYTNQESRAIKEARSNAHRILDTVIAEMSEGIG